MAAQDGRSRQRSDEMEPFLVTGAAGFIGSHFSIAARKQSFYVREMTKDGWDFRKPWMKSRTAPEANCIVHFGANVKARESVAHPTPFIADNVVGTFNVLELARRIKPRLFVYISTAEVLGGCLEGYLPEDAPPRPSNPYACSKAAGELLAYTYFRCYGVPAIIVRTQCVWSMSQQDQTKAVPIMKNRIATGESVQIYMKQGVVGSRQWIEVEEFCTRLLMLLEKAIPGNTYHIVGEELNNLQMAQMLADRLGMPLLSDPVEISPTHELRYAIRNTV
jgi:dTDP-glucose 4,6-dehydratase